MFKPRKTFKSHLIAIAVGGAATFIVAAPAQAYVMASSVLNMEDFEIKLGGTDTLLSRDDLDEFSFTGNANLAGDLTGSPGYSLSESTDEDGSPIDFDSQCIGSGCATLGIGENVFDTSLAAPPTGNYAAGDQLEQGSPIDGLVNFPDPADIGVSSYVGIETGTSVASADGNNSLLSSFNFETTADTELDFSFNISGLLQAAVSGDETAPSSANASYNFSFAIENLRNGNLVLNETPDLFGRIGRTTSRSAPVLGAEEIRREVNTRQTFSSGVLTSGTPYQVTFTASTTADATRVPEPATIALLGLGLAGLGMVGMRRRRSI